VIVPLRRSPFFRMTWSALTNVETRLMQRMTKEARANTMDLSQIATQRAELLNCISELPLTEVNTKLHQLTREKFQTKTGKTKAGPHARLRRRLWFYRCFKHLLYYSPGNGRVYLDALAFLLHFQAVQDGWRSFRCFLFFLLAIPK